MYREITEFRKKPEVFVKMFSDTLYIMDRNAERMMVEDLQKEVEDLKAKLNITEQKLDITEQKLDVTEQKLDVTEQKLDATKEATM